MTKDYEKYWTDAASKLLLNRRIIKVEYLTAEDAYNIFGESGPRSRCIALLLDNNVCIYPSQDDEGNGAGALFTTDNELETIPVI